ncbi:acyltransferase family protein [Micromonospora sp. NPDC004704]
MFPLLLRTARRSTVSVPLSKAYTGRANSFGFLRLGFAFAVVLAHAAVLGYDRALTTRVDIPGLAVAGFFGVSGFLITRSARRTSLPRFLWHRALRIWPGLWVCLLFVAFVVAPTFYYLRHGTLDGLWRHRVGVINYLQQNWWGGLRQGGIVDVFRFDTPYGIGHKRSLPNGSLWTLAYEIFCYLLVAGLAVLAVLRRARWLVLLFAVFVFGVLVYNHYQQLRFGHPPVFSSGEFGPLPLLGPLGKQWFLWYGFMFLAGGVAELYSDRLPINDLLGVAALAVIGWFAFRGELFGPGLLAYEYVILWLAVRLPKALHRVGQTNDYSYGVYIYSFVVEQVLAKYGVQKIGLAGYFVASALVSLVIAAFSWHLVEKQALRLKDWNPRLPWRGGRSGPDDGGDPEAREPVPGGGPTGATDPSDRGRPPVAVPAAG